MKKSQLKQVIKEEIQKILEDSNIIDKILDKISTSGIDSLTPQEKEYLNKHSKGEEDLVDPYDIENNALNERKKFLSFIKSNYDGILNYILKNDYDNNIVSFVPSTNIYKQFLITGKWNNYIDDVTSLDSPEKMYGLKIGKDIPLDFSEVLIKNYDDKPTYEDFLKQNNASPSIAQVFKYIEENEDLRSITISNYSDKDLPEVFGFDPQITFKPIPNIKYKNKPIYYRIINEYY
jgi:hypothetical protein